MFPCETKEGPAAGLDAAVETPKRPDPVARMGVIGIRDALIYASFANVTPGPNHTHSMQKPTFLPCRMLAQGPNASTKDVPKTSSLSV